MRSTPDRFTGTAAPALPGTGFPLPRAGAQDEGRRTMTCDLPGESGSIAAAREHARTFLDRVRPALPASVVEDAVLAISELVTNVVRHAPGPCTLRLEVDERAVHIAVSDTSCVTPKLKPAHPQGVGGFGLPMLFSLARDVETEVYESGKTVSMSLARDRAD
ncbi:ATP-binding protein [Actinospica durhamensis]|uniref:ATP-binding protein n=1 Tax=Actinospica durhamensis TaxID=1508375 RepID=A0A941EUJ5_9ACTN|nr:ATP-binding protein [Actinospica durhamensis]MBR7837556.1 ATP-binding protein [Actinospica durhamensis]